VRDADDRGSWNVGYVNGIAQTLICATCQTPEERAEAEANLASGATTEAVALDATEGRVVDEEELRRLNANAADEGAPSVADVAFDDGPPRYVGISPGSYDKWQAAVWIAAPDEEDTGPLIRSDDTRVPVFMVRGVPAQYARPLVISVTTEEWIGLDPAAIGPREYWETAQRLWREYVEGIPGE
jgi:hypothetical protein